MKPVTQESVLETLKRYKGPISFNQMCYEFILDEDRQFVRLERTLEKLHQQKKIEVIKEVNPLDVYFGDHKGGGMFRYYKFVAVTSE